MVTFDEVQLGEKLHASEVGGQITDGRNRIRVRNGYSVETSIISTGPPGTILLLHTMKGRGPRSRGPPDDTHGLSGLKILLHIS